MSLLLNVIEQKKIRFGSARTKRIGLIMAIAGGPAYLLSVLWSNPGYTFNIIGALSAVAQVIAFIMLISLVTDNGLELRKNLPKVSKAFLFIAGFAFAVKLILQFLSAAPAVAEMTIELRPIVIAYLHLVLMIVISLCLFVWYIEQNLIPQFLATQAIALFIVSFAGMEVALILAPWWSNIFGSDAYSSSVWLFLFSVMLSISCLLLYIFSTKRNLIKINA
jgi:hypothetical protein